MVVVVVVVEVVVVVVVVGPRPLRRRGTNSIFWGWGGWGGVGWGGANNVPLHLQKSRCFGQEGGDGVGWGGVGLKTFLCKCYYYAPVRSHALSHIRHATLLCVLIHFHTYVMLRFCAFSCTFTHTSCYASVRSHALSHIRHATLLCVLMHFHTYVMLRFCAFSCTFTHTSCYASVRSHALSHIRHATLLQETQQMSRNKKDAEKTK